MAPRPARPTAGALLWAWAAGVARSAAASGGTGGDGAVGAWVDLLNLVSSGGQSTDPVERFADDLGKDVYMDIGGWHLYLRDCRGLHQSLAAAIALRYRDEGYSEDAALDCASSIEVPLGGGKSKAKLLDLLPAFCVDDLTELSRAYADEVGL